MLPDKVVYKLLFYIGLWTQPLYTIYGIQWSNFLGKILVKIVPRNHDQILNGNAGQKFAQKFFQDIWGATLDVALVLGSGMRRQL